MIIEAREDTITLRGEIKSNIWPTIQAAAALLLKNHPKGIIIDASAITKITTKGAETFEDAFDYIYAHDARIVVAALSSEMLEIGKAFPGVRSQLPVTDTVEQARASIELEEITPHRGKALIAGVVPIVGNWERAVLYGEKLAVGESTEIHLVDLIKVPRTLPIGTPLPEREAAAKERLEQAKKHIEQTKLKGFTHIEKVRSKSAGLINFSAQLKADFTAISLDRGERGEPYIEQADAISMIESAESELSLLKGSPEDPYKIPSHVIVPAVGAWSHALEHACKLTAGENTLITVICPIVVPRSEPINASKPDAEGAAANCNKEALRIAKRYNANVKPVVERMRDPVLGIIKLFDTNKFDLAVVGVKNKSIEHYHIARAIALALINDAPCETILLKAGKY